MIARTDFADPTQRGALSRRLKQTMDFIEEHGGHEDSFVEPSVRAADPELASRVALDHRTLTMQGRAMMDMLANLEGSGGDDAVQVGARLHVAYSAFLGAYLTHMSVEEREVNQALWAHHTDDELAQVRGALQGSIPPPRFAEWFVLMVPAMNHQERVGMMTGMKMNAPAPVFEAMSALAEEALGAESWAKVAAALPS